MVIDMAMVHKFYLLNDEASEIGVHDDIIFHHLERFLTVDTFWGGFDKNPTKGFDYCGYTYIPPESIDELFEAIRGIHEFEELRELCLIAKKENAWIEHRGL